MYCFLCEISVNIIICSSAGFAQPCRSERNQIIDHTLKGDFGDQDQTSWNAISSGIKFWVMKIFLTVFQIILNLAFLLTITFLAVVVCNIPFEASGRCSRCLKMSFYGPVSHMVLYIINTYLWWSVRDTDQYRNWTWHKENDISVYAVFALSALFFFFKPGQCPALLAAVCRYMYNGCGFVPILSLTYLYLS